MKADTRQALATTVKGSKKGKGKQKGKGGKGKTFHIEQADAMLEALLTPSRETAGTPAAGAESGHLGARQEGGSTPLGSSGPSATSSGAPQAAAVPAAAPNADGSPPTPQPSGAGAVRMEGGGTPPGAAAGQPAGQVLSNQ